MSVNQQASTSKDSSGEYSSWLGKKEQRTEVIDPVRVAAFAATLDLTTDPEPGEELPPGWQWLFFNPVARRRELGADGHPKRGGFLPPIDLPRRLWAGSRITYLEPVIIGETATRHSEIVQIQNKAGRRGPLWFVTVKHITSMNDRVCSVEEQDIVYRGTLPSGTAPPPTEPAPAQAQWSREVHTDTTLLFRYSALTFNGHRIHYDQAYAQQVEGYPDLLVHGPLTATLIQQFVLDCHPGHRLKTFNFRGANPLYVGRPFTLQGQLDPATDTINTWARGPEGELSMQAVATLA